LRIDFFLGHWSTADDDEMNKELNVPKMRAKTFAPSEPVATAMRDTRAASRSYAMEETTLSECAYGGFETMSLL
jgi:hypothetical protein